MGTGAVGRAGHDRAGSLKVETGMIEQQVM
jgi:hypothetical protein